jgi:hypothetical protein
MSEIQLLEQWRKHTRVMLKLKPFSTKWKREAEMRAAYEDMLMDLWGCEHKDMICRIINQSHTQTMLKEATK